MKSTFLFLILALCLGVATSSFATDSYLCIGSKITFFIHDNNNKVCRTITEESYNIYEKVMSKCIGSSYNMTKSPKCPNIHA